jgi:hypothetical protein
LVGGRGAGLAKLSRDEREQIAETRLIRVLTSSVVANQRTLEQKISDAGPFNQRIDPHILTDVRNRLVHEGSIGVLNYSGAPWYFASNTGRDAVNEHLHKLIPIYRACHAAGSRIGQALEIATYRALCALPNADFSGRFRDLSAHDDSSMYKKEEPPQHIGTRELKGNERLDFILRTADAGPVAIECKNVRHWMYPHVEEITETLRKCIALNAVPVLIARRIPFVTFAVFSRCGFIVHQTYNQLFPQAEAELAAQARDKTLLGYHDIRTGNEPDARLLKFITVNLPNIVAPARAKFEEYKDLIEAYAAGDKHYDEFAARVLRRSRGENEDGPNKDPNTGQWLPGSGYE